MVKMLNQTKVFCQESKHSSTWNSHQLLTRSNTSTMRMMSKESSKSNSKNWWSFSLTKWTMKTPAISFKSHSSILEETSSSKMVRTLAHQRKSQMSLNLLSSSQPTILSGNYMRLMSMLDFTWLTKFWKAETVTRKSRKNWRLKRSNSVLCASSLWTRMVRWQMILLRKRRGP